MYIETTIFKGPLCWTSSWSLTKNEMTCLKWVQVLCVGASFPMCARPSYIFESVKSQRKRRDINIRAGWVTSTEKEEGTEKMKLKEPNSHLFLQRQWYVHVCFGWCSLKLSLPRTIVLCEMRKKSHLTKSKIVEFAVYVKRDVLFIILFHKYSSQTCFP